MDGHRLHQPPYVHATPQQYYHANSHTPTVSSGMGCPHCLKTATVLEALFNRIHLLEEKLSQTTADKDAAHHTLYRLVDVQAAGAVGCRSAPSTSATYGNSVKGTPKSSPRSSLDRNAEPRLTERTASGDDSAQLIDLLGPIEQPVIKGTSVTVHKTAASNTDSSEDEKVLSSPSSGIREHQNAGYSNVPHVHRFANKAGELAGPKEAVPKVKSPTSLNAKSSVTEKKIATKEEPSYCSSNDADSEGTPVQSGPTFHGTSFRGSLDPFESQQDVPAGSLAKNNSTPKHVVGLEHSMWAPRPVHAPKSTVSPRERLSKDCDDIAVKGPICNTVEFADAAILDREGRAAKFNRFRYLDAYNLCFNPGDAELGVYRTIIVTNLPARSTMTDVLSEVRGGTVLEAKMLDTFTITQSKSAMLTFVEGNDAMDLEEHAKVHRISIAGQNVGLSLVEVPTRPIGPKLHQGIKKHNQTRCLHIRGFPRHITPQNLRNDLRPCKETKLDYVESMTMNADGILELRFLSIAAAQHARELLASKSGKYRNCQIMYGPDPCAQAWYEAQKSPEQAEEYSNNEAGKEQDSLSSSKPESKAIEADSGLPAGAVVVETSEADNPKQDDVQESKLTGTVNSTVAIEEKPSLGFDWW